MKLERFATIHGLRCACERSCRPEKSGRNGGSRDRSGLRRGNSLTGKVRRGIGQRLPEIQRQVGNPDLSFADNLGEFHRPNHDDEIPAILADVEDSAHRTVGQKEYLSRQQLVGMGRAAIDRPDKAVGVL